MKNELEVLRGRVREALAYRELCFKRTLVMCGDSIEGVSLPEGATVDGLFDEFMRAIDAHIRLVFEYETLKKRGSEASGSVREDG